MDRVPCAAVQENPAASKMDAVLILPATTTPAAPAVAQVSPAAPAIPAHRVAVIREMTLALRKGPTATPVVPAKADSAPVKKRSSTVATAVKILSAMWISAAPAGSSAVIVNTVRTRPASVGLDLSAMEVAIVSIRSQIPMLAVNRLRHATGEHRYVLLVCAQRTAELCRNVITPASIPTAVRCTVAGAGIHARTMRFACREIVRASIRRQLAIPVPAPPTARVARPAVAIQVIPTWPSVLRTVPARSQWRSALGHPPSAYWRIASRSDDNRRCLRVWEIERQFIVKKLHSCEL